ncbi:MAG: (2Fe-2S)-binding protein [Deltaproteobacteria bacterium]|nr:(2Fe-2S)-binding protein [Deltaproteobacteria bacterium]
MEPKAKISLKIDGQEVTAPEGATILEAAQENGIRIPTLCHHPALSPYGGCRLCVVEVDGSPKLAASCVTPVRKGMEVVTSNERIVEVRRTILQFLLAERNHFCMFCAQSGDCELQNLAYEYQIDHLDVPSLEQDFPVDASHEYVVLDHNRCVLCGRCVRACREVAGASVLDFQNRGGRTMIGVDLAGGLGESTCLSCGLCAQVCPTGAIFRRQRTHYTVKGKPKEWQVVESCCPECGLLCEALYYVRGNNLLKIEGRFSDDGLSRGQLCRRGRFEAMETPASRLLEPMIRDEKGDWQKATWDEALDRAAAGLKAVQKDHGGGAILGLASSGCSNEEVTAFQNLMSAAWKDGYLDTLDGGHYRALAAAFNGAGRAFKEAPWSALLEADCVFEIGANPAQSHPIICSLLRRAVMEHKAKLAIIGEKNGIGPWASLHLPVPDGDLSLLIQALLTEVQEKSGSKPPEDLWETWVSRGFWELVKLFRESQNPVIIVGPALTGRDDPSGLKKAIKLARLKGRRPDEPLIVLKPSGNSAGAWELGVAARQSLNGSARPRGALVCLAEEESLPPGHLADATDLEFLTVITPRLSQELAAGANVLIPKPIWLEADGTYASADGSGSRFKVKVLEPPSGVEPAEKSLAALAGRLGVGSKGAKTKGKGGSKSRPAAK